MHLNLTTNYICCIFCDQRGIIFLCNLFIVWIILKKNETSSLHMHILHWAVDWNLKIFKALRHKPVYTFLCVYITSVFRIILYLEAMLIETKSFILLWFLLKLETVTVSLQFNYIKGFGTRKCYTFKIATYCKLFLCKLRPTVHGLVVISVCSYVIFP